MKHITDKLRQHVPGDIIEDLIEWLEKEIKKLVAEQVKADEAAIRQALEQIASLAKQVQNKSNQIMIADQELQADAKALDDAATATIALIPAGTPASTPDSSVRTFQASVRATTARLVAADGVVTPPPPPAAWQPNTVYAAGDKVVNPADGLTYSSNVAQTSGATFDPTLWTVVAARRR